MVLSAPGPKERLKGRFGTAVLCPLSGGAGAVCSRMLFAFTFADVFCLSVVTLHCNSLSASRGRVKGMNVDAHTDLAQIWEHFLPVSLSKMLAVVKERAALPIHRETGKCDVRGLKAFFCILFGACQFKPGTDLWSVKQAGMMPAPNFGRCMSQDKFRRWMKCLSMVNGPCGRRQQGAMA